MPTDDDLVITNVRIADGLPQTVAIRSGKLRFREADDMPGRIVDGRGGLLIAGLVDHHLHLMAEAVRLQSIDLSGIAAGDETALADRITGAHITGPIRATGLDDSGLALLDAAALDRIAPDQPLRIQYRTGALWVLNGKDLARVLDRIDIIPDAFERGADGKPNGRIWRGDHWLRASRAIPCLNGIGAALARWGVTAVTDASVTTNQAQADAIGRAARSALPQHLTLMSGGAISATSNSGWEVGPVKILLDDASLPTLEDLVGTIDRARRWGRAIAVHIVTPAELALALAAWDIAGAELGDRIEHGSLLPVEALDTIVKLGLRVVTNPGFVHARGDRYLDDPALPDRENLYRLRSLMEAGIPVAAGSDAPYGPLNPWQSIRASIDRRTKSGRTLGGREALASDRALALHCTDHRHAGRPVPLLDGAIANLVLLRPDWDLYEEPVAMTIISGKVVHESGYVSTLGVG